MEREFLEKLRVGEQALPEDVVEQILQEHEKTLQAQQLQAQQELKKLQFASLVKDAVHANRGRNLKAITALLDVETLQQQDDPKAVEQAVAKLKKEHGYLFLDDTAKPPYAQSSGMGADVGDNTSNTLAGALREKFRGDL